MRALFHRYLTTFRARKLGSIRGQTLVEYALILCVISIMGVVVFNALGDKLVVVFSTINDILDTAQGS